MIKLTRGALTMLLAQYRGILKNAWIKNFAVAAALATTVSSAYAETPKVTTWEQAVAGDVKLDGSDQNIGEESINGTLNLQTSIPYKDTVEKVTITGGTGHKIGGENTEQIILFSEQKVGDPDLEALYKTNKKELVIDASVSDATLTIANGNDSNAVSTGVAFGKVTVGGGANTATLNLQNKPTSQNYDFDNDVLEYSSIHNLTVKDKGVVNNSGYTDLEDRTIIEKDGVLTNTGILNIYGEKNEVAGTLTSLGIISFDSNNLTVKDGGKVEVQGTLNLADVGPVNINKLTKLADDTKSTAKITLTGETDFKGNKLSLSKKIANEDSKNYVKSLSGLEVTLGGNEYENDGLVGLVNVGSKLTALAKDGAYKINKDETITLDNESGKGEVASDLEVAGGTLTVKAGTWNAEGLKVSKGQSESDNSTVSVESNAVLALKTLEIANGQTLTVNNDGDVDGVLDLTKTTLVNATGKEAAAIKGTIANAGVVKITGEKLQGAIANVTGAEEKNNLGYIFDNTGVIEVAGPTTLATGAFLADTSKSGIKNDGNLAVDGALTVNGEKDKASELKNAGKITASSLTLKGMDYDKSKDEMTNDGALFTVTDGTYNIAGTVSTGSDLKIGEKATVNAQSLEAHTIDVEGGKVGSAEKPLTSIKAGGEFTSLAGSKVFAGTISADELVNLGGDVTADKITSGDKFTVTAGTHKFGEVSSAKDFTVTAGNVTANSLTSQAGISLNGGTVTTDSLKATGDLSVDNGTHTFGSVNAAKINVADGSVGVKGALSTGKFTQEAGSVTVTDGSFKASETTATGLILAGATKADLGALTAATANSLTLKDTATAEVKSYAGKVDTTEAAEGSVVIGQGTTLTVSDSLANNTAGDAIKVEGTLDVSTSVLGLKAASAENTYETKVDFADASLKGILKINDANALFESGKISKEQLAGLKNAISKGDSDAAFTGKLALTGVSADLGDGATSDDAKNGSHTLDSVKDFAGSLTGDAALNSATIDVGNGETAVSGEFGNLIADVSAGKVSIAEATLQGSGSSSATNGYYISAVKGDDAKKVVLAGAELAAGSSLTLAGAGKIGNIDANADGNGKLTVNADVTAEKIGSTNAIGALTVSSGTLTAKDVKANVTTIEGNLVAVSLTTTGGALTTGKNAVVTAENISVGDNSSLYGKVTASGTLSMNNHELNIGAVDGAGAVTSTGTVSAKTLDSTSGAVNVNAGSLSVTGDTPTTLSGGLKVGKAGTVSFAKDVTLETVASTIEGSLSANVLTASEALSVNGGGNVNVAELTGSGDITVGQDGVPNGTGSVYANKLTSTGKIFIDPNFGQQAAFVGAEHLHTVDGIEETTGDIVVGKNAALAVGVSSEAQARSVLSSLGLTDANGSFKQNGVENAIYTDALVKLGTRKGLTVDSSAGALTTAGQIKLGDKSAVVIGKNAAAQSVKTGNAVLTADIADVGVKAAGKSTVIFAGNATKQDIKDVKIFGNDDNGGTVISPADAANVSVQLSPLYNEAKLTVDGGITDITVNRGYINKALYNASLPIKNLVAEVADTAVTGDGVGSDFIMDNALVDGGANIESAARLATFGGAYQAAAAAVNTGIDAAQARLGLGIDNSAEVKGEDISVWANAVYKNTESDSFEAQGANYGADLDLTSLVIGADYNMTEGSKVGAYATFGTGDVDGKGAGHNVKNDVDTYGFGIYGSAKLASGVSILSDVGYTVAQNEFKGIVNADADMKVFTAGANVKYTFNTQVADISPFVGARYTSFNLESYAVKSAKGIVAYTDADTAHIFSIPVGFDLSKQITAGEWNVKPAFTAKVTFNTGDKTVSSSTQFTGVKNALNLDAEVMDDVTYSVGASVSAAKGAATFGAGLSYTGSSETNELSAQIGARYTF